jgi:hypothetical protein
MAHDWDPSVEEAKKFMEGFGVFASKPNIKYALKKRKKEQAEIDKMIEEEVAEIEKEMGHGKR